ncbi:2-iminobutanoate/2-iminopropanoate deaminase [Diplonema papillatum]|nr:2-iminobutanoate/2-iminopropanoate deaminase [Diplonema papillatum]|eukprot:gene20213-31077_t
MKPISTENAAAAVGPYVQGYEHNGTLYVSGCIGIRAKESTLVEGGVMEQAKTAFDNLEAVLKAGGSDMQHVLKTTVFLKEMKDFAEVNKLYEVRFGGHKPARACVAAAELPKGALFEIDCIAIQA